MMDELRRKILLMHNYRRSLLTKGLVKNANGITLPPAANMVKLKYNCALEVLALSHAAKCAFNESDLLSQEDVGENVAVVYTENALTFLGAIRWALTSWWKTIGKEQSVMGRMVKFKKKHEGKSIRRFTQMAWADTQEVGCGIAKCGAAYNVVCRYSPSITSADEYYLDDPYQVALKRWVSTAESKYFGSNTTTFQGDGDLLCFANMIRSNTTHVGCSERKCGTTAIFACFYDSPNINKGELMYEIGNGCSNDTDCTTYPGSSCDVKSGLCSGPRSSVLTQSSSKNSTAVGVAKSNIPATKPQTEKSLSEKQTSQNGTCLCYSHHNSLDLENSPSVIGLRSVNDGIMELGVVAQTQDSNTMCQGSRAMTDKLRQNILLMHNWRRSFLAQGLVGKKVGRNVAPAGNMMKLKYSCELEIFAFAYASMCISETSDPGNGNGAGENIAAVHPENASTPEKALQWAVESWWKSHHGEPYPVTRTVMVPIERLGMPISYFTQMIWAETEEIGCGIVKCGEIFNVVCRYYPGGNHLDRLIYEPGEPCSKCPYWTGCEVDTGFSDEGNGAETLAVVKFIMALAQSWLLLQIDNLQIAISMPRFK
ncbi:hypothetical protein RB195_001288 [Necator americanus]|uniref:SCP domain-containing protein n=1 Tax=Necator americanus TaxID=51031 RepID=A0ABR1DGJ1_NECAM